LYSWTGVVVGLLLLSSSPTGSALSADVVILVASLKGGGVMFSSNGNLIIEVGLIALLGKARQKVSISGSGGGSMCAPSVQPSVGLSGRMYGSG
jgi:hypothetical protein